MGVVSKYGNLYDVKKNIICHAPVPKLFGIHAVKKFQRGRWRRVLTH